MGPQLRPHVLELFCQGVRVMGTVTTHVRVSDMMNQDDTWLSMDGIQLWPLSAGEHDAAEEHDLGRLRKSSIEIACEAGGPPASPAVISGFHVPKSPRRVLVLTANYAVRADLHVTSLADVQATLDVFRGRFLPLTMAAVTPISPERVQGGFARAFLMLNMEMVNLVCDATEAPPIFFPD